MAARSGSPASASEKKLSNFENELMAFSAENLQNNMKVTFYRIFHLIILVCQHFSKGKQWFILRISRTFLSIIGGVVAGILGLTGLKGFILYFIIMAVGSLGVITKAKFDIHEYFDSWNRVILDGITGGLMSFVLFWTFAYDIVHIF